MQVQLDLKFPNEVLKCNEESLRFLVPRNDILNRFIHIKRKM